MFRESMQDEFRRYLDEHPIDYGNDTPNFGTLYEGFQSFMSQQIPCGASNFSQPSSSTRPTSSSNPVREDSASVLRVTVDDLLQAPGRSTLTELHPHRIGRATWFKHDNGEISKAILTMLKSDLPGPYPTFRSLPADVKKRWFRAFAQQFNWNRSITKTVAIAFEEKAKDSFSSNLYEWKDRWKLGKGKPEWMDPDLWEGYIRMWNDDKVIATSKKNSKNKNSDRGGFGKSIHTSGAKSFQRRMDELTAKNGGIEPDRLKLLEEVHRSRKSGEIKDKKVKRIVELVSDEIEIQSSQNATHDGSGQPIKLTQTEINELVFKETPIVKGRRFGFGTLPDPCFEGGCLATTSQDQAELLRLANEKITLAADEIKLLKKEGKDKDKQINYLTRVTTKLVAKFPDLYDEEQDEEDDDETQE